MNGRAALNYPPAAVVFRMPPRDAFMALGSRAGAERPVRW